MAMKNDRYTYRVTWSEDDNEYVGLCAEFPSLSWLAKNPQAALKGIRKSVKDVVKDMRKFIVRVPPQVHRNLAIQAAESGVSLNRLASSRLSQ
jgi:hypothetical protein